MLTDQDLKDLLFTLDICEDNLPMNAHPAHYERLDRIRRMLHARAEPQYRLPDSISEALNSGDGVYRP